MPPWTHTPPSVQRGRTSPLPAPAQTAGGRGRSPAAAETSFRDARAGGLDRPLPLYGCPVLFSRRSQPALLSARPLSTPDGRAGQGRTDTAVGHGEGTPRPSSWGLARSGAVGLDQSSRPSGRGGQFLSSPPLRGGDTEASGQRDPLTAAGDTRALVSNPAAPRLVFTVPTYLGSRRAAGRAAGQHRPCPCPCRGRPPGRSQRLAPSSPSRERLSDWRARSADMGSPAAVVPTGGGQGARSSDFSSFLLLKKPNQLQIRAKDSKPRPPATSRPAHSAPPPRAPCRPFPSRDPPRHVTAGAVT